MNKYRSEPQIFKTQFKGWDDIIPVDYTRTSESVRKRGVDLHVSIYKLNEFSI